MGLYPHEVTEWISIFSNLQSGFLLSRGTEFSWTTSRQLPDLQGLSFRMIFLAITLGPTGDHSVIQFRNVE